MSITNSIDLDGREHGWYEIQTTSLARPEWERARDTVQYGNREAAMEEARRLAELAQRDRSWITGVRVIKIVARAIEAHPVPLEARA
jgi:hypothetical protein